MSTLAEVGRQVALVLVGWSAISLVAVGPIVRWMRRRAALNEGVLPLLTGQEADEPGPLPAAGPRTITPAR